MIDDRLYCARVSGVPLQLLVPHRLLRMTSAICAIVWLSCAPVTAQQTTPPSPAPPSPAPAEIAPVPGPLLSSPGQNLLPGNQNDQGWAPAVQNPFNTTVIPRTPSFDAARAQSRKTGVELRAFVTQTSPQMIAEGLVWRVYSIGGGIDTKPKLLSVHRKSAPKLELPAGTYIVNASLGRANLSRKLTIKPGVVPLERFVLNAGGLRVIGTLANGNLIPANAINYDIYSDERNQFGSRTRILGPMKPGIVIRLNAGIYHIVSTYGDANAQVRSDVTVEAGKLTVARVSHLAARITLKLVLQSGGDALADTKWRLANSKGVIIKQSVGAIPSHIIAAGDYTVSAHHGNRIYQATFSLAADEDAQIEVVMQ